MQAHKRQTGSKYQYHTAYLQSFGMRRAWQADSINRAGEYRRKKFGKGLISDRLREASYWRGVLAGMRAAA